MKSKADKFNKQQKELAEFAKALSHPARIAIIQLLAEKKEIKTGNISDYLPIARTTVSQHLKILKDAGIILGTIDGLKIHYCLDMEKLNDIKEKQNKFLNSVISDFICQC
ncbi:MAG TPA: metalloregulator ArsR/SmtB family transcription factor [Bacteroidales bacterium]|jgi:DNA-binding transcriptional ArsR family regulator|nr:metalloregulator ArsR/SmtB family transcription factor [Bacteroidales bacterium]